MLTDSHRTYGWKPYMDALLVQLVGAGYSWSVIATLCGRTRKEAQHRWSVLQSEGAVPALKKRRKARIRWTRKMDDLLISLRQEGAPWAEVAVRLGVSLYAAWSRGQKIKQKEMGLVDQDGQATLLRERNRGVEEKAGCTRQDEALKRGGVRWTQDEDQKARRRVHVVGLGNAEIARRLGCTRKRPWNCGSKGCACSRQGTN